VYLHPSKNKLCAVIPFFNEESHIQQTVEKVSEYVDFIIAVDDGSTDSSSDLISQIEKVKIFRHEKNLGKGVALKTGFKMAIENGCDFVFTIDADMQHDPEFIPSFIKKMTDEKLDIVIGNRLGNLSSMPVHRRASNFLTSYLLSKKTKYNILDSQSGYRLFNCSKLNKLLPKFTGFEAESEILVKAARNNLKIGFVDIPTIYNDNQSKMKSLEAIIGFIKVLFI
jgi:glycosyltransferase involved in cell wall biosynthesis